MVTIPSHSHSKHDSQFYPVIVQANFATNAGAQRHDFDHCRQQGEVMAAGCPVALGTTATPKS